MIDVLIPGVMGLLLLVFPKLFVKKDHKPGAVKQLRIIGLVLLLAGLLIFAGKAGRM